MINLQKLVLALLMLITAISFAATPVRVHVRYVNAALWPRTFDATPENMTNIYAGTRATNVVVSEQLTGLSPIHFYKTVFGTNTPEIVWVSELKIWRYNPSLTNYSVAHYYRNKAMRTDTNFTQNLQEGDVVFFHGTVD